MNSKCHILLLFLFLLTPPFSWASSIKENDDLIIENKNVKLTFSGSNDFLFKEFIMDGQNILPKEGSSTIPWQLTYKGPNGENPVLLPKWGDYIGGEIRKEQGSTTLVFTWQMVIDEIHTYPVRILVSLDDDAELPEWNIEAELPTGWVITEVEFPRIAVSKPEDAKAILPVGFGTEYKLGNDGLLQSRYPSCTGGMQLVLMYHQGGAVYFSAKDKGASGKIFKMKSEGKSLVFIQNVTTSYGWTQHNIFSLPWKTVMGFTKRGWQDAVDKWYRPFTFQTQWGAKTLPERNIVKWIKNADLWIRPMNVSDETMASVREALKFFGKGIGLHWYYWHHYPHDVKYPEYFPPKLGFEDMVKEAQKLGGYVTPYMNGRLWDPATETYKTRNGRDASCRKPDGTLYTEVYSSKVLNTVTCPSSPIWCDILKEVNRKILTDIKTNGVYIDQIGAASSEPCYATNHGHAPGGGDWWPKSYRRLIQEMRSDIYNENQAMTTEENAECYIDLFDMMLTVNSPHNNWVKMVPLFPFVYSDRCIYSGYTYIPESTTDGSLEFITMRSFLWGSQLGWTEPGFIMKPEAKNIALFLKTLADFRRKQHDLFLGGRFMNDIILSGDNPVRDIPDYETVHVVSAAEWISVSGAHAYLIVNMDDKSHTVELPNTKKITIKPHNCMRIDK